LLRHPGAPIQDFLDSPAHWPQGPPTRELAPVKKTIYSLIDLRAILFGCNRRYLEHLSALDDFSAGVRALDRLTKPRKVEDKTVTGINFFDPVDNALLHALQDPRVNRSGWLRRDSVSVPLSGSSAGWVNPLPLPGPFAGRA
jgi:hypothetical protein